MNLMQISNLQRTNAWIEFHFLNILLTKQDEVIKTDLCYALTHVIQVLQKDSYCITYQEEYVVLLTTSRSEYRDCRN